ncbi:uncharacterized protein BYT42DRAFT_543789 [Radiomyces spectabilis]|uniref:uncharacterized protein n=1 Tax=Radiomyces spectabilis TaxID=64574 RepID=UPI00221F1794|nr:uncharacterized protein BYT42DRAFT_543789 [Radiomyces spectabilis]KAI8388500.1 hypothetical protein BYT42DRAFT_543789 [Radiomyces spectabilis]
MSGFFASNETTRWGGLLKQAISNVETTFDTLLEQNSQNAQSSQNRGAANDANAEVETYVDPITGDVTIVQRQKKVPKNITPASTSTPSPASPTHIPRQSSDLSARLAAVMADKAGARRSTSSRPSSIISTSSDTKNDSPAVPLTSVSQDDHVAESPKQPSASPAPSNAEQPHEKPLNDEAIPIENFADNAPNNVSEEQVTAALNNALPFSETAEGGVTTETAKASLNTDAKESDHNNETKKGDLKKEMTKEDPDAETSKDDLNTEATEDGVDKETTEGGPNLQVEAGTETSRDLDRILEQREKQLLQAMETIAKLHDQMHQTQKEHESEIKEIEKLLLKAQESSGKSSGPSNYQMKKLENTINDLKRQISTKDEQIQGLMNEGEKLSKNELKHSNTIKKLRAEKNDQEKTITEMQKKIDKTSADLVDANAKYMKLSEGEKRLQESVSTLSTLTEEQTRHINKLETEALAAKDRYTQLQAKLDSTLEGLEEDKSKAKRESEEAHAAALEKEIKANDRLHKEMSKVRELQIALQRAEEQSGSREDNLRSEIAELQQRLQLAENHVNDISTDVEEATAPLLRQIEQLQTQHSLTVKSRDQTEQSLILRLQEAEQERDKVNKTLETLRAEHASMSERLGKCETELMAERQVKATIAAQLEEQQLAKSMLESRLADMEEHAESRSTDVGKDAEYWKNYYEAQMQEAVEAEAKKWQQKLNEERANSESSSPSPAPSDEKSLTDYEKRNWLAHLPYVNGQDVSYVNSSPRSSIDDTSSRSGAYTSSRHPRVVIDRYEASIRQLENQLEFRNTQFDSLTQSRDELAEEVLQMTLEMEKL